MKMPNDLIREEILKKSAIPFARFMELALYCPQTGYYETKSDIIGHAGDFITSVSVGSLFGELLAFQFASWLENLQKTDAPWRLIEAGAHDGKLARDILSWLQINRPRLLNQTEYVIIEPSSRRQAWQQETLATLTAHVRWQSEITALSPCHGIIFSNELLDAFPMHRLGWDAAKQAWFEWGVELAGENFRWTRLPPSVRVQDLCPPELAPVLPDGYVLETCPAAENWWRQAAGVLAGGKLLAIDYGQTFAEHFSPANPSGTLRSYSRHQVSSDLLSTPGQQDLTAHVYFPAIQQAGETAGLVTEQFCTQPQFLTRILQNAQTEKTFAQFSPKQARQFQTLTHPEHLGRAFRVLVQSRPG